MGWCNMYPRLIQQKAVPLLISAYTWRDLVAVETGENKIHDIIRIAVVAGSAHSVQSSAKTIG